MRLARVGSSSPERSCRPRRRDSHRHERSRRRPWRRSRRERFRLGDHERRGLPGCSRPAPARSTAGSRRRSRKRLAPIPSSNEVEADRMTGTRTARRDAGDRSCESHVHGMHGPRSLR